MSWPGGAAALLLTACLAGVGCRFARPEAAVAAPREGVEASRPQPAVAKPEPRPVVPELPAGPAGDLARKGQAIVENTPAALQQASQRAGRPAPQGRLSCRHCHLDGGTRASAFPWTGLSGAYPRYEPRVGRLVGLAEQVNNCVTRCLNAPPLSAESPEMAAILAYIGALPAPVADRRLAIEFPDRLADLAAGEEVYRDFCRRCHGADGAGDPAVPPLWGSESYATGAPMHRVSVAAAFIRAQMPPDGARLNAADAFDVAAFVNSFARPETADLHLDYPALSEKPADCPYPPYPDRFPVDRHKYGPFGDILADRQAAATGRQGK